MKYIIITLLVLAGFAAKAQLPSSTFPSRIFNGNTKAQWLILDSPVVNPILDTFNARYPGTQLVRIQGGDTALWFGAGGHLWFRALLNRDTISLSNRINLKLNISDTTGKWLAQSTRLVDTIYRVNDSTVGYTIKGAPYTFQILGSAQGGGGGSGLTSVGLSMPSAFSVSGSPLTSNGTINVFGAGTSAQYIRGNGTLNTTDTGMIPNFYLKVRSLFSGTSPITYNSTTGAIGINNANTTGTKGAASFTSQFSDNGSGLIDLADLVSAGSCTGCVLNINAKGRITSYSDGAGGGINNINIGSGFRPVNAITQEMRTCFAGFGQRIDSIANANGLTWSADTTRGSGLPTYFYVDSLSGITADNGLTKTGTNIQLGGTLIQPTNITSAVSANRIIYNGISAFGDGPQLEVTTSGSTGIAVSGGTTDGRGIFGEATTGVGVYGTAVGLGGYGLFGNSVLGNAIYGQADSGVVFEGAMNPTSNANILPIMTLLRSTQSTPANGMGQSIDFYLRSTIGNQLAGQLAWKWTNATDASRTSQFEIYGVNTGLTARKAALAGSGQWTWDGYPALTAQVDTTTYKPIAIDGSGNVVKMAGWAGSGGGGGAQDIVDTVNKYLPIDTIYSSSYYVHTASQKGTDSVWKITSSGTDLNFVKTEVGADVIKMIISVEDDIIVVDSVPFVGGNMDNSGDSYTAGVAASPGSSAYVPLLATDLSITAHNDAESGTGIMDVQFKSYRDYAAFGQANRNPRTIMIGFNDYLKSTNGSATQAMFPYAFRAAILNHFLDTAVASNDPNVTTTGTWATYDLSASYPQKSKYLLSGTGRLSVAGAAGDSKTYSFEGENVGVFFLGANGTTQVYGRFKVEIDGNPIDTVDESGIADNQSVVANSATRTEDLVGAAVVYAGLSNSAHSIKVTLLDNVNTNIDAFGVMSTPLTSQSLVVGSLQKLLSAGYTVMSAGSPKNDAGVDVTNAIIQAVVNEFRLLGYRVVFNDVNAFTNPASDLDADNIHWNNAGHAAGKTSFRSKIIR